MAYTKELFIRKSKDVFGDKYNYSKVEYINSQTKVKIICPIHGEFMQRPAEHIRGRGCLLCGHTTIGRKQKEMAAKEFVQRCKKIHGDKYLYDKVHYVDALTKVVVTCKKHGDFLVKPNTLLNGSGCAKCKADHLHDFFSKSQSGYISEVKQIYGMRYDYSQTTYYNNKRKIKVICPKHGIFKINPLSHLKGAGCPQCGGYLGEIKITAFLEKKHIEYIRQYYIKELSPNDTQQRFFIDFYIPSRKLAIEYNGEQHYKSIEFFGGDNAFAKQKKRDKRLSELCKEMGIILYTISYKDYSRIETILNTIFI